MAVNDYRIRGFDGLRGIAVMMVVACHKLSIPGDLGAVGVWLFFAISGFLIVRILARARFRIEAEALPAGPVIAGFLRRRAARLLPLYYLILSICAAISLFVAIPGYAPDQRAYYWLHGANFLIAESDRFLPRFGHLWSLAVEEQFYLLMAPLLLLLPRKYTFVACALVAVIGMAAIIALAGASPILRHVHPLTNFMMLAIGGMFGLIAEKPLPRFMTTSAAQMASFSLFLIACLAPIPLADGEQLFIAQFAVIFAALLLMQIFQGQKSWFITALEGAPFAPIGRISYGLYLIHPFVVLPAPPGGVISIAEIAISLILAALSWRYFEAPIMRWAGARRLPLAPTPAPAA